MKKEEILKNLNLGIREIEAFGGTIKVRNLTIKEMLEATKIEDENVSMLTMVSNAIVEPEMSITDLESLDSSAITELVKIVNEITPKT